MFPELATTTKILFPKVNPFRLFAVGEVTLSKVDPLSVDLTMFPETPPATKISFPKVTPLRRFPVGDVALSKDVPLSVDLKMSPLPPVATNTLGFAEEELSEVLVELSEELSEVLVELSEESSEDEVELSVLAVLLSSDFAHEETINAILTIRTNQDNIFFILFLHRKCCKIKTTHLHVTTFGLFYKEKKLKRKRERMMSICLNWFPISGLGEPNI